MPHNFWQKIACFFKNQLDISFPLNPRNFWQKISCFFSRSTGHIVPTKSVNKICKILGKSCLLWLQVGPIWTNSVTGLSEITHNLAIWLKKEAVQDFFAPHIWFGCTISKMCCLKWRNWYWRGVQAKMHRPCTGPTKN